MKNLTFLVLTLIFLGITAFIKASNTNYMAGTRQAGIAGCGVALTDGWSSWYNQAGLARIESATLGLHHENRFILPDLGLSAAFFAIPSSLGTFGVNVYYFGNKNYNENKLSLNYSKSFGNSVSAGIQFNYMNTYVAEKYGNIGVFVFEGGIQYCPFKDLNIGIHIFNPNQVKNKNFEDESVPSTIRAGLAYRFVNFILWTAEIETEFDEELILRTGLEIEAIDDLFVRGGIASEPSNFSFGLGYKFKKFTTNIAFSNHQLLGITPYFSIEYAF